MTRKVAVYFVENWIDVDKINCVTEVSNQMSDVVPHIHMYIDK